MEDSNLSLRRINVLTYDKLFVSVLSARVKEEEGYRSVL